MHLNKTTKSSYNIELSNTKAWLIVDSSGSIKYSNATFKNIFNVGKESRLKNLNLTPNLENVIIKLLENNLSEFKNSFIFATDERIYNFLVEIEKINLFNSDYFAIVFNLHDEERVFEDKISNLHYALEFGAIPVIIFDKNGIISFATNAGEELLGFELDSLYNSHISKLFKPYLKSEQLDLFLAAIEEGVEWKDSISVKLNDGLLHHLELQSNPVLNEDGNIFNFILSVHDITYYVFKNEVVKKSENQLKTIINNISDLLIILKKNNNGIYFEDANDNFLKKFDLVKSSSQKLKYGDIFPSILSEAIGLSISEMEKKSNSVEDFQINFGGDIYSGKITSVENSIDGELLYIISLKDVSEEIEKKEKLKELYRKEMQVNRLKTTFLQNMSHEIRTPFTAIMGYSDILVECIEDKDFETVVEITDSLKHVLNRVMNLFENILEVSEIETGGVKLDNVAINCNQILNAVYNKKLDECKEKGLAFELDLEESSYLCNVDWIKFERVILNLVENAIKYTDKGRVKITSKKMNDHVVITISDTGLGINQKIVSQLLEPFVQEEQDGHSRNYEGAGLGLTIAHEYTKLMNGRMDIFSEKNVGTEVFLNFPILQQ